MIISEEIIISTASYQGFENASKSFTKITMPQIGLGMIYNKSELNNRIPQESKTVFCMLLSIITILNGYSIGTSNGVSIAMIISSAYIIYSIMMIIACKNCKITFDISLLVLVLFLIFISCFSLLSVYIDNTRSVIYDMLKLIVWASFVTLAGYLFFDYRAFLKYMMIVAVISTIYLCIQYLLYYGLHINVPNTFRLGFIVPYHESYAYVYDVSKTDFRPGSFWVEPAFYGYYVNCLLAICLFDAKQIPIKKRSSLVALLLFLCLGIILSLSTGAIGIMLVLFLLKYIQITKRNIVLSVLLLIGAISAGYGIIKTRFYTNWGRFGANIGSSIYKLENLRTNVRTGSSFNLLSYLSDLQHWIGLGIGNDESIVIHNRIMYMNSITTLLVWTGYIGLAGFLLIMLRYLIKSFNNPLKIVLMIVYIVDGLFSSIYFGVHSFMYLLIILYMPD